MSDYEDHLLRLLDDSDPTPFHRAWRAERPSGWLGHPDFYLKLGKTLLRRDEPLLAHDILTEGLSVAPKHLQFRQQLALAQARTGAVDAAQAILDELLREGHRDGDTYGIFARTYKDLWERSGNPEVRLEYIRISHDKYLEGFQLAIAVRSRPEAEWLDDAIYTGINAASTAVFAGNLEKARYLAGQVRDYCRKRVQSGARDYCRYWAEASLAEALVILGEWAEAAELYAKAAGLIPGDHAELARTRQQARWLMEHLGGNRNHFDRCFGLGRVVIFVGHMIDWPGRSQPRFPSSMEDAVTAEIRKRLDQLNAGFGYSSAACGSDILFQEAMAEQKGVERHILLPFAAQDFRRASVEIVPEGDWGRRFEKVLAGARVRTACAEELEHGSIAYEYANLMLHGIASARARRLGDELIGLAVWNGEEGDGPGGTADVVRRWRETGCTPEIIRPQDLLKTHPGPAPTPEAGAPATTRSHGREPEMKIMTVLFADVAGFTKMTEAEIPRFLEHYWEPVADLLKQWECQPEVWNTWGDGLILVFPKAQEAGRFALRLQDMIRGIDWVSKGLRSPLNLRIALHTGPVFPYKNPLTERQDCFGSHVSHSARLEPRVQEGRVYASQIFADLVAAEGVTDFACDYVGEIEWAKNYGCFPTYVLHWEKRPESGRLPVTAIGERSWRAADPRRLVDKSGDAG
jgi:class 3 adenylate cyclase/tetratricopeptide (TPR) repeat protein